MVHIARDARSEGSSQSPAASEPTGDIGTFYSLGFRNYRLLWFSNVFSAVGMWLQMTTLGWVVYDMTGSGTLLGSMNGMRAIPMLLLAPLSGVVADGANRRNLMLGSQVILLCLTFGLGVGLVLHQIEVWHLFAFTMLAGTVQVFLQPAQQTVVFDLVPRRAIPNAIALSAAGFNATQVFAPSVAGFLIAALGPEGNFFVQSAAYLGVLISLLMIAFPPRRGTPDRTVGSVWRDLLEGLRYVAKSPTPRLLLMMALMPPLLIMPPIMGLMPVFAKDVFHTGPKGLGFLMSAVGAGGLMGALFAASLGRFERRGLIQLGALGLASVALLGFSFTRSLAAALPLLVLVGFSVLLYMATTHTMVQLSVPDKMRGRVTSLLMLNMGLMSLGSLLAGMLADLIGAPRVAAISAALAVTLALGLFLLVPRVRHLRLSQLAAGPSGSATAVSSGSSATRP